MRIDQGASYLVVVGGADVLYLHRCCPFLFPALRPAFLDGRGRGGREGGREGWKEGVGKVDVEGGGAIGEGGEEEGEGRGRRRRWEGGRRGSRSSGSIDLSSFLSVRRLRGGGEGGRGRRVLPPSLLTHDKLPPHPPSLHPSLRPPLLLLPPDQLDSTIPSIESALFVVTLGIAHFVTHPGSRAA